MKKIVLSLIAATAAIMAGTGTASAQNFDCAEGFSWGPKAGLNVTTMSNADLNSKASFTAGMFGQMHTANWFALSLEVLYSRQGGMKKHTVAGIKNKNKIKTEYLNVPLLANFYVTRGLALKTGVQVGFCLSARQVVETGGVTAKQGITGQFHTADVAIPVGISYDWGRLVFDARYNFGVSHAMKEGSSRNGVFQFTAGFRF